MYGGWAASAGTSGAQLSKGGGGGMDLSKMMGGGGGGKEQSGGGGKLPERGVPFDAAAVIPAYLQAYNQTFGGGMPIYDTTAGMSSEQKRAQAITAAGLGGGASDVALIALLLNKLFSGNKKSATSYSPGSTGFNTGSGETIPGVNAPYKGFG